MLFESIAVARELRNNRSTPAARTRKELVVALHSGEIGTSSVPANANCAEVLATRVSAHGWAARTAVISADGTWTHGQLHDLAARAATVMAGRGLSTGDRMLLALPDGIGWFVAFLAAARLGVVAVCVNPWLSEA